VNCPSNVIQHTGEPQWGPPAADFERKSGSDDDYSVHPHSDCQDRAPPFAKSLSSRIKKRKRRLDQMKIIIFVIVAMFFTILITKDYAKNRELNIKDLFIIIGGAIFFACLILS
jgi:hypothetical protein